MSKPNETIKSYYSANVCANCGSYSNGMCLKYNSKPYIARHECDKLHKILEDNKKNRLQQEELQRQQAFESKYIRICKIKELLDSNVSDEDILKKLNIGKNRLKSDKRLIKSILKVRENIDMGFSDEMIWRKTRYDLSLIAMCKIYINRNSNLFR